METRESGVSGFARGWVRREIAVIGANEVPQSCERCETAAPIEFSAQLFRTYALAGPSMFLEEAGGCAFLVELAGAITAAYALYRTEDGAAFSERGGAPEPPPPVVVDSLMRARFDQIRAVVGDAPLEEAAGAPMGEKRQWPKNYLIRRQSPRTGSRINRRRASTPPL